MISNKSLVTNQLRFNIFMIGPLNDKFPNYLAIIKNVAVEYKIYFHVILFQLKSINA